MNNKDPNKILVVAPSWIGDMVMAQSLLIKLKRQYPQAEIHIFVPDWCRNLLKRMPEVTDVVPNPFKHGQLMLVQRFRLGRELHKMNFDLCIVLPNSLKSALVPWFASIPVRRGWKGEQRYFLLNQMFTHKEKLPLMVQRYDALVFSPKEIHITGPENVGELPQPRLVSYPDKAPTILEKLGIKEYSSAMGLCPGAEYGPAKRWLPEYYAKVASAWIKEKGPIFIFGGKKDTQVADAIIACIDPEIRKHCYDLTGRTELTEAVDLLSSCSIVVTNDTGLMHVAAAVGTPLVAIYGSSSTGYTPPLSDKAKTVFLTNLNCRPCFERNCPHKSMECLVDLKPELVVQEINNLLGCNLLLESK